MISCRGLNSVSQKQACCNTRLWAVAVTWSDVGGYDDVKSRLRQALEWPLKHTAAFKRLGLLAPRGILLYGPPGKHHFVPCCPLCQPPALAVCNGLVLRNAATSITSFSHPCPACSKTCTDCQGLTSPRPRLPHDVGPARVPVKIVLRGVGCAGCSKTRMAQAAAGGSGMRLQPLSGAQLFSMYVGEGEALLRDAFQRARLTAPAIIFIDEIDAIVGAPQHEATLCIQLQPMLLKAMPSLLHMHCAAMVW